MLKSANLLHKCGLGDSDMSSTVAVVAASASQPRAPVYIGAELRGTRGLQQRSCLIL